MAEFYVQWFLYLSDVITFIRAIRAHITVFSMQIGSKCALRLYLFI